MSRNIRNSVKAIIIENGNVLLNKCDLGDGICYIFPGGGQEYEETFIEALHRECFEELGAEIEVKNLIWIREYIGKNHEFAKEQNNPHQIEYYFVCKLKTPVDLSKATNIDTGQLGIEWLPLSRILEFNIFPKVIKNYFSEDGSFDAPLYAGDVN